MPRNVLFYLIGFILFFRVINVVALEIRADWGDTVTVDYVLSVEGEEKERNRLDGVVLGDGFYLSEFEAGIIGLKINETASIDIPPEGGYPSGHASGYGDKWMHFDITLISIDIDIDLTTSYYSSTSVSNALSSQISPSKVTGLVFPTLIVMIVFIALNRVHSRG